MEHKKIDNLFQNELKNLEVSPNKRVWNSIETKLTKKKRRIFPFWLLSGSVAAILVLGLFLHPFSEGDNQNINTNSNEIITTIPEKKSTFQNKVDSLILNNNKTQEVFITKSITTTNHQKEESNLFVDEKNNTNILPKKRVNKILLSNYQIDKNLVPKKEEPTIIVTTLIDKIETKKIDLNDYLSKEEFSKVKKSTIKNWSVAPMFAVLKSNSFTNTSPINENLANSTKGENSYSYGIQVAYKLNKKWTIQSGIHLQEMSYSNNHIRVSVSELNSVSNTQFANGDSFSFIDNNNNEFSLISDQTNPIGSNGNLAQNYGYIEIPVEVKYNFSNNSKFETHLVTGFSSLFLNKNVVHLNTETLSRTLKPVNLNNFNFSSNLGFDFNYLFDKNWSLNLNPMLKIQLNTFNKDDNGFAPFNIGIYSGIKYKF